MNCTAMLCVLPFDVPAAGLLYNWQFRRSIAGLIAAAGQLGRTWGGGTAAFAAFHSIATADLAACVVSCPITAMFTNALCTIWHSLLPLLITIRLFPHVPAPGITGTSMAMASKSAKSASSWVLHQKQCPSLHAML